MVSVVEVRASRDLSHAHVYISVLGDAQARKDCSAALRSATGFIRREIVRRIRLRIAPELHFVFDESIERGIRMTQLIDQAVGKPSATAKVSEQEVDPESEQDSHD